MSAKPCSDEYMIYSFYFVIKMYFCSREIGVSGFLWAIDHCLVTRVWGYPLKFSKRATINMKVGSWVVDASELVLLRVLSLWLSPSFLV